MADWIFVLTPLLVLPIVLLFRFIGCGELLAAGEDAPPARPSYRDYIMGVAAGNPNAPDVVGYWRLIEAAGATTAKDETGFQDGQYKEGTALPPESPTATTAGSEAAPGGFLPGQPGLIVTDPAALGRFFNGAYVMVPFKQGLFTDEFTLEAWIDVRWGQTTPGYMHTLFRAGGLYDMPFDSTTTQSYHGFTVFAVRGPFDDRWQVNLQPSSTTALQGGRVGDALQAPPIVSRTGRTHLALRVQNDDSGGVKKRVTLFLDGKPTGIGLVNSFSRPDYAPLFIGVTNRENNPSNPPAPREPILSVVQEVVLHRVALSNEEIEKHFRINETNLTS